MSNRGRRATFPDSASQDVDAGYDPVVRTLDPRRFRVRVNDGGELTIDLSAWSHANFTTAVAPLLQEFVRRMGPAPIKKTLAGKVRYVRRFWRFLDETATTLEALDDVTVAVIDRYESWLEQHPIGQSQVRNVISALIALLRLAIEQDPDRFSPALATRLTWLGRGERAPCRPRDAYSSGVTAAVRDAARRQVADAAKRLLRADAVPRRRADVEDCPALHSMYDDVIAIIVRDGCIQGTDPVCERLKHALQRHNLPPLYVEPLHGQFHLTRFDVVGFLALLSLQTGMEIECLAGLKADCLRNPSRGYVEIEYCKRRARGSEWKRLRVRDGGSSTPGGIIRQAIRMTERARKHTGADALWTWWCVAVGLRPHGVDHYNVVSFVKHHQLTDDDGRPLRLELSRLRKTQKAERYLRTQGQLEDFAIGHTVPVAARHYADIPALRHIHEQTIADALREALDVAFKPTLLPPAMEEAVRANPESSGLPGPPDQTNALLDGEQDVWLASCSGFHSSPFGRQGDACPTPFWGCLECANAVITARKLPALIAFDAFMVAQRAVMDEGAWSARFGRAHRRIVEQILPAFPEKVVADARAKSVPDLMYLPPEASAF